MGAAPLLLAMAMVTADVGWETDGRGGYQYIVQIPAEQWETVRREGAITSQIPEQLRGRISSIKIRVGDGPMPRHEIVAASETIRKLPGPPDTTNTVRAQGGDGFQMPTTDSLRDIGKEAATTFQQQAGSQFNELARQAGQQVGEAVDNAAQNFRNSTNNAMNGMSNAGSGGQTGGPTTAPAQLNAPPPLQPTAGPTTFGPTTFGQTNTGQTGTMQPNTAQSRAGAPATNSPTANSTTGPTTRPSTNATGFPSVDSSSSSPWSADPNTRANQTGAGQTGDTQANTQPNNTLQSTPGYTNNSTDPPILTQQAATTDKSTLAMEQRLRAAEAEFQFDEEDYLIVNEPVLYVVGVSAEVGIDATGRLYDKSTKKWLRENDPRYRQVINFVDQYNSVRKERLASRGGAGGLLLSNASPPPTYPSRNTSIFDNGAAGGFGSTLTHSGFATNPTTNNLFNNPSAANPNLAPQNTTTQNTAAQNATNPLYSPAIAMSVKDQVELELLRREREVEKERLASKTATTAASAAQQSLANQTANQVDYRNSPSDGETTKKRPAAEMQSQPLFNFLLLLSILGNFYLGIAISRLLKRYRILVASHRGNTLAA